MICIVQHISPGLDLYSTDPAQHIPSTDWDVDDLDYVFFPMRGTIWLKRGQVVDPFGGPYLQRGTSS